MFFFQSLVIPEKFQHILRVMGTNIDGNRKVMFAMTAIKGVGRRYANIVLKKADIDLDKRAGECSEEEVKNFNSNIYICKKKYILNGQFFQVEKIVTIMANPRQYKIPDWFLNRQKDIVDGKYSQVRKILFKNYAAKVTTDWTTSIIQSVGSFC